MDSLNTITVIVDYLFKIYKPCQLILWPIVLCVKKLTILGGVVLLYVAGPSDPAV
jgi:hypothetical protein